MPEIGRRAGRSWLPAALLGATLGFLACGPAPLGCQPPSDGRPIYVASSHSGRCAEILRYGVEDGDAAGQWRCRGAANQRWKVAEKGAGELELKNVHSGMCLDAGPGAPGNGAPVVQGPCSGEPRQRWKLVPGPEESCRIVHAGSGKCLVVGDARMEDGAVLGLWDCHTGANQLWELR